MFSKLGKILETGLTQFVLALAGGLLALAGDSIPFISLPSSLPPDVVTAIGTAIGTLGLTNLFGREKKKRELMKVLSKHHPDRLEDLAAKYKVKL